jgi:hypothetical protein
LVAILINTCIPLHLFGELVGTILLRGRANIDGFTLLLEIVEVLCVNEQTQHVFDVSLLLILLLLRSGGGVRHHVGAGATGI